MKTEIFYSILNFGTKELIRHDDAQALVTKIKKVCEKSDLKPILKNFELDFKRKISVFNLNLSINLIALEGLEIFLDSKKKILLIFQIQRVWLLDHSIYITQFIIVQGGSQSSYAVINKIKKIKELKNTKEGLFGENLKKQELEEKLSNISPNGKVLANKEFKEIFSIIFIKSNRELLRSIQIENPSNKHKEKNEILSTLKVDKIKVLEELLENKKIFEKSFNLKCQACSRIDHSLQFISEVSARKIFQEGSGRFVCSCKSKNANVVPTYYLTGEILRACSGVWLEKFVDEKLLKYSQLKWPCRMNESDELDNVLLYRNYVILVECKDKIFSQNDLYIVSTKARKLEADKILIVTTKRLSENIKNLIKNFNESERMKITAMILENDNSFNDQLEIYFSDLNKEFLNSLINKSRRQKGRFIDNSPDYDVGLV